MTQTKNEITISIVGDILCWKEQNDLAYDSESNNYNYSDSFKLIKKYFENSDYVMGNLETTLSGIENKYTFISETSWYTRIMFNTPDKFAEALKNAGFNLLTTANNHCMDRGINGVLKTLHVLDKYSLEHIGTYESQANRDTIFLKNIGDFKVAFLNYTHGINYYAHNNSIPKNKPYLINLLARPESQAYEFGTTPCDIKLSKTKQLLYKLKGTNTTPVDERIREKVLADIKKAKEQSPDLIIVIPHMGVQYKSYPSRFSRKWVDALFEAGADAVIAGHPHVLQPMEFRTIIDNDGTKRTGFVIYSMGNFITSPLYEPTDNALASIILNLHIKKDQSDDATISSVSFIPTWVQCRDDAENLVIRTVSIYDALHNPEIKGQIAEKEREIMPSVQRNLVTLLTGSKYLHEDMKVEYVLTPTDPKPWKNTEWYFWGIELFTILLKMVYIIFPLQFGIKLFRRISRVSRIK